MTIVYVDGDGYYRKKRKVIGITESPDGYHLLLDDNFKPIVTKEIAKIIWERDYTKEV